MFMKWCSLCTSAYKKLFLASCENDTQLLIVLFRKLTTFIFLMEMFSGKALNFTILPSSLKKKFGGRYEFHFKLLHLYKVSLFLR